MKNLFVSYNIAKELSILNFNEPCIGCYRNGQFMTRIGSKNSKLSTLKKSKLDSRINEYIAAPTFQQAINWIFERYQIWIYVELYDNGKFDWNCVSTHYKEETIYPDGFQDTPQLAIELGLLKAINDIKNIGL